jgi:integrase
MTEQTERKRRHRRPVLTDQQVADLPKKKDRYTKPDPEQRGHYVRVMPDGPNVYYALARNPYGRQIWHRIDTADVLKIAEAREQAREAIKRIEKGLPAVEPLPDQPDAFKKIAESWLTRHVRKNKLRTQAEIERVLQKYILPHWADRAFTGIRRKDVADLLDYVEDHHGPRQADVCLGVVRNMGNWFASRDESYISPVARNMRRHKRGARSRILSDDELRAVWKQAKATDSFGRLIQILLLTGQRRAACLNMRWSDIDADNVWTIPVEDERAKSHAGTLMLPAQALAIIKAQPKMKDNPYVFAASRGHGPMNGFSKVKAKFDEACGVTGWTLHDLRRCARSLMSRAGVPPHIAERVLGHAVPGIEGVYDRHHFFEEKAEALLKLSSLIDNIINPPPENVVPIRRKAKAKVSA